MNLSNKVPLFFPLVLWFFSASLFAQGTPRPISLEEGLHLALSRNETLLIAREDLEKSRHQIREAYADALPQLNASLSYTRNHFLPSFLFDTPQGQQQVTVGARNNLTGGIGIRQPLYSGGKTMAALNIARLYRTFSEETTRKAHQQVHADVETAFYDLLLSEELVRVTRLAISRARANLNRVEKLRQVGRVSDYDLLRAQVQVAELRPDSIRAENGMALAALSFKTLVGIDPHEPISAQGAFREISPIRTADGDDLLAQSLVSRPEMRQQNLEVQMRLKAETLSQANARPSLDLLINGQWEAQKNSFDFSTDDFRKSWFSGLSLSFPIFDGFRTGAQVAQARADSRKAELTRSQIERAIRLSVLRVHQQCHEAELRKTAQSQTVALSRKGLRIAESRYENGVGTQLEVIDAQLTLRRAEAELALARRDLAVALVHLEYQVGILGEAPISKE